MEPMLHKSEDGIIQQLEVDLVRPKSNYVQLWNPYTLNSKFDQCCHLYSCLLGFDFNTPVGIKPGGMRNKTLNTSATDSACILHQFIYPSSDWIVTQNAVVQCYFMSVCDGLTGGAGAEQNENEDVAQSSDNGVEPRLEEASEEETLGDAGPTNPSGLPLDRLGTSEAWVLLDSDGNTQEVTRRDVIILLGGRSANSVLAESLAHPMPHLPLQWSTHSDTGGIPAPTLEPIIHESLLLLQQADSGGEQSSHHQLHLERKTGNMLLYITSPSAGSMNGVPSVRFIDIDTEMIHIWRHSQVFNRDLGIAASSHSPEAAEEASGSSTHAGQEAVSRRKERRGSFFRKLLLPSKPSRSHLDSSSHCSEPERDVDRVEREMEWHSYEKQLQKEGSRTATLEGRHPVVITDQSCLQDVDEKLIGECLWADKLDTSTPIQDVQRSSHTQERMLQDVFRELQELRIQVFDSENVLKQCISKYITDKQLEKQLWTAVNTYSSMQLEGEHRVNSLASDLIQEHVQSFRVLQQNMEASNASLKRKNHALEDENIQLLKRLEHMQLKLMHRAGETQSGSSREEMCSLNNEKLRSRLCSTQGQLDNAEKQLHEVEAQMHSLSDQVLSLQFELEKQKMLTTRSISERKLEQAALNRELTSKSLILKHSVEAAHVLVEDMERLRKLLQDAGTNVHINWSKLKNHGSSLTDLLHICRGCLNELGRELLSSHFQVQQVEHELLVVTEGKNQLHKLLEDSEQRGEVIGKELGLLTGEKEELGAQVHNLTVENFRIQEQLSIVSESHTILLAETTKLGLKQATSEKQKLSAWFSDAQKLKAETENETKKLIEEIKRMKSRIKDLEIQNMGLSKEIEIMHRQNYGSATNAVDLEKKCFKEALERSYLSKQLKAFQMENAALMESQQTLVTQIQLLQTDLGLVTQENAVFKNQIMNSENRIRCLEKDKFATFERQATQVYQQTNSRISLPGGIEEKQKLLQAVEKHLETIGELQKELGEKNAVVSQLQRNLDTVQQEKKCVCEEKLQLQGALESERQKSSNFMEDNAELKDILKASEKELELSHQQLSSVSRELSIQVCRCKILESSRQQDLDLAKQLEMSQQQLKAMEAELEGSLQRELELQKKLEVTHQQWLKEIKNSRHRQMELERELQLTQQHLKQMEKCKCKILHLEKELDQAQQRVKEMEASHNQELKLAQQKLRQTEKCKCKIPQVEKELELSQQQLQSLEGLCHQEVELEMELELTQLQLKEMKKCKCKILQLTRALETAQQQLKNMEDSNLQEVELKKKLEVAQQQLKKMEDSQHQEVELEKELELAEQRLKEVGGSHYQKVEVKDDLELNHQELKDLEKYKCKVSEMEKELELAEQQLKELEKCKFKILELEKAIDLSQQQLKGLEKCRCKILELEKSLDSNQEQLKKLEECRCKILELEKVLDSNQEQLKELEECRCKILELEKALVSSQEQLKELEECRCKILELEKALDSNREQLNELEECRCKILELEKALDSNQEQLKELEECRCKILELEKALDSNQEQLKELEECRCKILELEKALDSNQGQLKELEECRCKILELEKALYSDQQQIRDLESSRQQVLELEKQLELGRQQVFKLQDQLHSSHLYIMELENQQEQARQSLREAEENLSVEMCKCEGLGNRLQQLNQMLSKMEVQMKELDLELQDAKEKLIQYEHHICNMDRGFAEHVSQIQRDGQKETTELRQEMELLRDANKQLKDELNSKIKCNRCGSAILELNSCKDRLNQCVMDYNALRKEYRAFQEGEAQRVKGLCDLVHNMENCRQAAESDKERNNNEKLHLHLDNCRCTNEKLQEELDNCRCNNEKLEAEFDNYRRDNEKLRGELNNCRCDNEKMQQGFENCRCNNETLQEELNNCRCDNEKLQHDLNNFRCANEKLQRGLESCTTDLSKLVQEVTAERKQQRELLHELKDLGLQKLQVEYKLTETKAAKEMMEHENQDLSDKLLQSARFLVKERNLRESAENRSQELVSSLMQLKADNDSKKCKIKSMTKVVKEMALEAEQNKCKVDELLSHKDRLQHHCECLQRKQKALEEKLAAAQEVAKQREANLKEHISLRKNMLEVSSEKIQALEERLTYLRRELTEAREKLLMQQYSYGQIQKQIVGLQVEKRELYLQLQELRGNIENKIEFQNGILKKPLEESSCRNERLLRLVNMSSSSKLTIDEASHCSS